MRDGKEWPLQRNCKLRKPGVKDRLLKAIKKGLTLRLACAYAGVGYMSLRKWLMKGEEISQLSEEEIEKHPRKLYYDFWLEYTYAESVAALWCLDKVDRASETQWQAAAWKLERRYPHEYGRNTNLEEKTDENAREIERVRDEVSRLKREGNDASE